MALLNFSHKSKSNNDSRFAISSTFRVKILAFLFLLLGFLILSRLFTWQVVRGEELSRIGRGQQKALKTLSASRGSILASDNFPLASSSVGWLIWASLPGIKDPVEVVEKLAPLFIDSIEDVKEDGTEKTVEEKEAEGKQILLKERERLLGLLMKKDVVWVPLKRRVNNQTKEVIDGLKLQGIGSDMEEKRSYPEGTMAASILGFVGKDAAGSDKGYFGMEGHYDVALSGVTGERAWEKDALGNPILSGDSRQILALDGVDLKTHIDRSIQFLIEKHLLDGLQKYGASQGTVIVMRPFDGAILGMASFPSYDPMDFTKYKQDFFINPAVSQSFEPGSIFKVLIMASAFDSGAVKPSDECDQCSGPVKIGRYTIGTWDDKYYPNSTPIEIIQHSDNVGMVWVASRVGAEKLYNYLTKFGIGAPTGIDLQGELTPSFRPWEKWGQIGLATIGFGQGIAVTPIQMVRAVSAIANKGKMPTPQVVDKLAGEGWEEDVSPQLSESIISSETAEEITGMMVDAVKAGEAKWTAARGYSVAGKTGTAQIAVRGLYDEEKTIASFIGFALSDDPKFVMLVTLREPASSPWASETAAPLWFAIARDLFFHFGIAPEK
ncbi:MAG: penicillin-binding protein 2 [Candidatus Blackburnbacteria bacterium]|nr:penicillin-binding protein 2 [Candidatus Blackburnbacteria bacterium]